MRQVWREESLALVYWSKEKKESNQKHWVAYQGAVKAKNIMTMFLNYRARIRLFSHMIQVFKDSWQNWIILITVLIEWSKIFDFEEKVVIQNIAKIENLEGCTKIFFLAYSCVMKIVCMAYENCFRISQLHISKSYCIGSYITKSCFCCFTSNVDLTIWNPVFAVLHLSYLIYSRYLQILQTKLITCSMF